MLRRQIVTDRAPRPGGGYSQAVAVGNCVWVASQGPYDPITRAVAGETIEEQTERTLDNIEAILNAAGATMADVVKTTVHLSDASLFSRFDAVYSRYFPGVKPARTTVGSQIFGILVMIDAVAYVGKNDKVGS